MESSLVLPAFLLGVALVPATALRAAAQEPEQDRNELFESMATQIIEGYLRTNPEAAVAKARKTHTPFNEKAFHDQLLSFGSPAPKYARLLMGL